MRTHNDQGGTSVEYGLIATLMATAIVAGGLVLGQTNHNSYQDSCERISTAMGSTC